MNIALIELNHTEELLPPPLTLAYLATLLEQRRHIVRIYDLALDPGVPFDTALRPLYSFRPQMVLISSTDQDAITEAVDALQVCAPTQVITLAMRRNGVDVLDACSTALQLIERHVQRSAAPLLPAAERLSFNHLDQLPFPARHLLSLEHYGLRAVGGELQTTVVLGALLPNHEVVLRTPSQIVAELRTISHEFGLRHYRFPDLPITLDICWLRDLLHRLDGAQLGIRWEARADAEQLDQALVNHLARAGCEALWFDFDAAQVFDSAATRLRLRSVFDHARSLGIFLRAYVKIEPPYESVPRLVDVAATFGMDDVTFDVLHADAVGMQADRTQLQARVRQLYDEGRDRQRFINRFGPALGNLIWRLRGPQQRNLSQFDDDGMAV